VAMRLGAARTRPRRPGGKTTTTDTPEPPAVRELQMNIDDGEQDRHARPDVGTRPVAIVGGGISSCADLPRSARWS
jgi:hypothetical protein